MDDDLEEIRLRRKREMLERLSGGKAKDSPGMPDRPVELNDDTLDKAIKDYPLVVVDCWAAWCAPCRMIAPIVEELARKYSGKIVFGKLDVDQNRRTAIKYQLMSIPALLVFKEGKRADTIIGYMPARALEQKITKHL